MKINNWLSPHSFEQSVCHVLVALMFVCLVLRLFYHFQVTSSDASVESILKSPDCGLSAECGGCVLFSAPSTHFTVGYSSVNMEEDEVNSPPPRVRLPVIASPSPLRPRHIINSFDDDGRLSSRAKKILCSSGGPPPTARCDTVCTPTSPPPPPIFLWFVIFFG